MSTQINVTVDSGGLADEDKQQRRSMRWAKLEKDGRSRVYRTGLDERRKALNQQGKAPNGKPKPSAPAPVLRRDKPAVFRFGGPPNVLFSGAAGANLTYQENKPNGLTRKYGKWFVYPFTGTQTLGTPYIEEFTIADDYPGTSSGYTALTSYQESGTTPYSDFTYSYAPSNKGTLVSYTPANAALFPYTEIITYTTYWHSFAQYTNRVNFPSKDALYSVAGISWDWYWIKRVRVITIVHNFDIITFGNPYYFGFQRYTTTIDDQFTSASSSERKYKAWRWTANMQNAMSSLTDTAYNPQVKEIPCPQAVKDIFKDKYLPIFTPFTYSLTYSQNPPDAVGYDQSTNSVIYAPGPMYSNSPDTSTWGSTEPPDPLRYNRVNDVTHRAVQGMTFGRPTTPGVFTAFKDEDLPQGVFRKYLTNERVPGQTTTPYPYRFRFSPDGTVDKYTGPFKFETFTYYNNSNIAWDGAVPDYCYQQLLQLGFTPYQY